MHKDFIDRVGYHAELGGADEILEGKVLPVAYTYLRSHETPEHVAWRVLL